jgi:aromatic-L-amino-acid decarboxylase
LLAPVPFSTVCLRWRPAALAGRASEDGIAERLNDANVAIMDAVNRTGEVLLSHTRLDGVFTIRVAIGSLRTEARHVSRAWELLRAAAADQRIDS